MADTKTTAELVEFMVRQASDGEMPTNVLYYSLNKLYEADMQKNNNLSQQPQTIVQPVVTAEPQTSIFSRPEPRIQPQSVVSQTPVDPVINSQQSQRERDTFGRPSQPVASQVQQPVQPSQPQPVASQVQQPSQPQPAASQVQQPVQPNQSQPVASQVQQPVQPSQPQPAASQVQQSSQPQPAVPQQPVTTGPQANAQALNNLNLSNQRAQLLMQMEPRRLEILKKKVIAKENNLKIKCDSAAKSRKFIYTLTTILATLACAHGVNGYLETFVEFCRGTLEGLATYATASAIMGVGLLFIAYAKEKAFNKPKFEKFHFLKGLQDFMNAENIHKKLDFTTESKNLIAAEETRRASI